MSNADSVSNDQPDDHTITAKKTRTRATSMVKTRPSQSKQEHISNIKPGAGVAGIGGGTLIAALAKNLPDTNEWKSWMLILAPSVSICVTVLWTYINQSLETYIGKLNTERVIKEARIELNRIIDNPSTSDEVKASSVKERDDLDRAVVTLRMNRVKFYISKHNS